MKVEVSLTTRNMDALTADLHFMRLNFSSNPDNLKASILSDEFKKAIGLFGEAQYKKSPFFYCQTEYQSQETEYTDKIKNTIEANTEIYFNTFRQLVSFLWLKRDNCCSIGSIYIYLPEHKTVFERTIGAQYSNCKGIENERVSFTNKEIEETFMEYAEISTKFYHRNIRASKSTDPQPDLIIERTITPYDIKKENRLERALNFLDRARKTRLLPEKIAFFMCIYESLFYGRNEGEITHQIAERVALYASGARFFRHAQYKLIKDAYKVRSAYFHGNSFKNYTEEKLISISAGIDSLTRMVLKKVLLEDADIFLQDDDQLQLSFMDLLFEDDRKPSGLTIDTQIKHKQFKSMR